MVEDFSTLQKKMTEATDQTRSLLSKIELKEEEKKNSEEQLKKITQDISSLQRSKDPKDIQDPGNLNKQSQALRAKLPYINNDLQGLKSQAIRLRNSNPDLVKIFPQLGTIR